jgi:nitroreductase
MRAVHDRLGSMDQEGFEAVVRDPCLAHHFRKEAVPREDVEHMTSLATCAVTACAVQPWRFIAIQEPQLVRSMQNAVLERFEELAMKPGLALQEQKRTVARAQALLFAKAPLCMAVLAVPHASPMEELLELGGMTAEEREQVCVRPELQSAGAAVQLLTTAAHSMGYAACWTCAPIVAAERLEALLEVQPPARLVALVAIGRPAELPKAAAHRPLDEVLSFR